MYFKKRSFKTFAECLILIGCLAIGLFLKMMWKYDAWSEEGFMEFGVLLLAGIIFLAAGIPIFIWVLKVQNGDRNVRIDKNLAYQFTMTIDDRMPEMMTSLDQYQRAIDEIADRKDGTVTVVITPDMGTITGYQITYEDDMFHMFLYRRCQEGIGMWTKWYMDKVLAITDMNTLYIKHKALDTGNLRYKGIQG